MQTATIPYSGPKTYGQAMQAISDGQPVDQVVNMLDRAGYVGVAAHIRHDHLVRRIVDALGGEARVSLFLHAEAMADLLRRVADHFSDTDAPLGIEARELLARING